MEKEQNERIEKKTQKTVRLGVEVGSLSPGPGMGVWYT